VLHANRIVGAFEENIFKKGDVVTVVQLPQNLARYDGTVGEVVGFESSAEAKGEEPRVWIKLPDEIRELPIRCPKTCLRKERRKSSLFDDVQQKALLTDGEEVGMRKGKTMEEFMAEFRPLATQGFEISAIPEEEEEEEAAAAEEGGGPGDTAKWDPTKRHMWEEKLLQRKKDMVKVVAARCLLLVDHIARHVALSLSNAAR